MKKEFELLTAAMEYVPKWGFTQKAVAMACSDGKASLGFNGNLIGALYKDNVEHELAWTHLRNCRERLASKELLDRLDAARYTDAFGNERQTTEMDRAKWLVKERLLMNAPIRGRLTELMAILVQPACWGKSLEELHQLSDDVAFYAGDRSTDFAWYSKRMAFSAVYLQCEAFMSKDTSQDFVNTLAFVDARLDEVDKLGSAYNDVEEWGIFNAWSVVNLVRSQIVKG